MISGDARRRMSVDEEKEAVQKMPPPSSRSLGVSKDQIEKRIQRRLDAIQPAQVVSLKEDLLACAPE